MVEKKISIAKIVKEYILITVGVFAYCFSWIAFVLPKGISGGGVTGIATIIQYATNGQIPIQISYITINVFLLVAGTIILGKGFGFKTIYSILMATFFLGILPHYEWITTLSDISDKLVNAVLAGIISGVGIALIFNMGGSTGGTDILALVLTKYYNTSPGKIFLYSDLVIVGSIILLPGKGLGDVIYGYIFTVSFSYMVDTLLSGRQQSVQMLIFSQKYDEVADMLISEEKRGVTALSCVGWYTKSEGKVLVVVARKMQVGEISAAIKGVDKKAFITVGTVSAVYGEGFEEVKTKKKDLAKETKFGRFIRWVSKA